MSGLIFNAPMFPVIISNLNELRGKEHGDYTFTIQKTTNRLLVIRKKYNVNKDCLTVSPSYSTVGKFDTDGKTLQEVLAYINDNFNTNFVSEDGVDLTMFGKRYKMNIAKAVEMGLLTRV